MRTELAVLTLVAWLAFVFSRTLQRRKVPELVAFLAVGAIAGPSGLGLLEHEDLTQLAPLTEVALAVLMFLVGERVSARALRAQRWVLRAGVVSYVVTAAAIYAVTTSLGAEPTTALLLAVLGGAGAPMTMASVVASARARGPFAEGLIGSHAVVDALAAIFFAAVVPIALLYEDPATGGRNALETFLQLGVGGATLGIVLGLVVARVSARTETTGELLLLVLVHVLVAATIAGMLGLSLPLAALVMGAVAASASTPDAAQRVFVSARSVEQPLYLVFFALAGASIHFQDLGSVGVIGAGYVAARLVAKVVAGFLGGILGHLKPITALHLGAGHIAQAGVAVGLAVLAAEELPDTGRSAATIVLGSVVFFELVGPLLASRALRATPGATVTKRAEAETNPDDQPVDETLPRVMLLASSGPLEMPAWLLDWCARTGAELVVLGPGATLPAHGIASGASEAPRDDSLNLLRRRAADENVAMHWRELDDDASFAAQVIDTAADVGADIVAVVTVPMNSPGAWMRSGPEERIARQLTGPVLLLKGKRSFTGSDGRREASEHAKTPSRRVIG